MASVSSENGIFLRQLSIQASFLTTVNKQKIIEETKSLIAMTITDNTVVVISPSLETFKSHLLWLTLLDQGD